MHQLQQTRPAPAPWLPSAYSEFVVFILLIYCRFCSYSECFLFGFPWVNESIPIFLYYTERYHWFNKWKCRFCKHMHMHTHWTYFSSLPCLHMLVYPVKSTSRFSAITNCYKTLIKNNLVIHCNLCMLEKQSNLCITNCYKTYSEFDSHVVIKLYNMVILADQQKSVSSTPSKNSTPRSHSIFSSKVLRVFFFSRCQSP